MSKRKIENRHIRNIQKHKGSYSVSLPIDIVRKFNNVMPHDMYAEEGDNNIVCIPRKDDNTRNWKSEYHVMENDYNISYEK